VGAERAAPRLNGRPTIAIDEVDGATWASAYASYGGNNRTQMLRVPEPGRVENRTIDGAANPYLAFTVLPLHQMIEVFVT